MAIERTFSIIKPDANAVHGSDGPDTAKTEIAFFFEDDEICGRNR